ncbi:haloacid dehalogenase-like hydrolase superfamily protein [Striga asiatica]|uniref:Haloacid dehalogenase-like hydrolase superfamily protein n=1 Tax=Striga asiatica TaxID=4170 RepID=A0A5A7QH85_STRAF|nr:haloacid dehalogenase-like hydrolase superfamily protein [Striga asiatica]
MGPMLTQLPTLTRYPFMSPCPYAVPPINTLIILAPKLCLKINVINLNNKNIYFATFPVNRFPALIAMDSHFASDSAFECVIFDLDDTLYSSKTGIGQAVKRNVQDFLVEKCGFSESEAPIVNAEFFRTYGSSLAGLRASGYNINPEDYHSFVHGRLPYDLIRPDPRLRNLLQSIKQRKIIFTNSDRIHAIKALNRIGIRDCFEKIISFETMNPNLSMSTRPDEFPVVLKPSIEAMKIAIDAAEVDPRRTVGRSIRCKGADYALESLGDMVQVIPALWVNEEDDKERVIHKRGEMESIIAPTPVGA